MTWPHPEVEPDLFQPAATLEWVPVPGNKMAVRSRCQTYAVCKIGWGDRHTYEASVIGGAVLVMGAASMLEAKKCCEAHYSNEKR